MAYQLTRETLSDSSAVVEDDEIYHELGRRIAARRSFLRITQAEVGERMGVSRASVANIEAGRQKLQVHQLYAIARALGFGDLSDILPTKVPALDGDSLLSDREDVSAVQRAQFESLVRNAVAAARPRSRKP
jgi:transcriptional regulator with XRE-family HTH domain